MSDMAPAPSARLPERMALLRALERRSIVLVGMMGSGKSSVGRKLAQTLQLQFVDSDVEIEKQCGMPISDFFSKYGEAEFRRGEQRIIASVLKQGPQILATGGGVFCNAATQANVRANGLSIWLKEDALTLLPRVLRRNSRPMLVGEEPSAKFLQLCMEREQYYVAADVTIELRNRQRDKVVQEIVDKSAMLTDILNGRRAST